MGAWGIKTFENDDAGDWLYDLEESNDLSVLKSAFEASREEYIEAPEGCSALAAAEVLLGLIGKPRENLPENARKWIESHKHLDGSVLTTEGASAVAAVVSDKSELKELWEEAGEDFSNWKIDVDQIRKLLADS